MATNPIGNESPGDEHDRNVHQNFGFRPPRETIDTAQNISEPTAYWPKINEIKIIVTETNIRWTDITKRSTNIPMNLGALALQTRTYPTNDYTMHVVPDESRHDEFHRGSYAGIRQGMKSIKNGALMMIWIERSGWSGRNIAKNVSFSWRKR